MDVRAPRVPGLYKIEHLASGRVYIGSSADLGARLRHHRGSLNRGTHHCSILQRAWRKYGPEAFTCSVLILCSRENLHFYEQRAIDSYQAVDRNKGFNLNPTARPGRCMPHSSETRLRISQAKKGRPNGLLGKRRSPEVAAGIRARFKGRPMPPQALEAAWASSRGNKYHLGHSHSDDARARMSLKTRGEKNCHSVIRESDVPVIRARSAAGETGMRIAEDYGVHCTSIYSILNRKTWRHVP